MASFPQLNSNRRRWLLVVIYAIAMAWVESAVVFYLRSMIHRIEPYQPDPFPILGGFGWVELIRELSTMVMLFAVGALAGRTWRVRMGYFAIAFGIWDVFYYVFLKAICGWPHSLMDWDVLFLLPVPWWGPVLAPVLISLLMIFWGTLASQFERTHAPALSNWPVEGRGLQPASTSKLQSALKRHECRAPQTGASPVWVLNVAGVVLALYVFMADTLAAVPRGLEVVCSVLPEKFNWPLFLVAWLLMAAPAIRTGWQLFTRQEARPEISGTAPNLDANAT